VTTPSTFLTDAELAQLTGYVHPANRRKWLKKRGWVFETAANGQPVVARQYAEFRLGVSYAPRGSPPNKRL